MEIKKLHLEQTKSGISGITEYFGGFMSECAVFCFNSQNHHSGITILIKTDSGDKEFEINWDTKITDKMKRTMNNPEQITEFGAMCLAILMTLNLTEFRGFEVSQKRTGIDFWLFKEDTDDLNLSASARLEISGIRKETAQNNLTSRLKIKKKQVAQSSKTGLPAFISIVEFGKPAAVFLSK